jgi:hypothetical protein
VKAAAIVLEDPGGSPHGGTLRSAAIVGALASEGYAVEVCAPSAHALGTRFGGTTVARLKRNLLPMPTTFGATDAALRDAVLQVGPVDLVFVGAFQHFALSGLMDARLRWFDFPDVLSAFALRESKARRGLGRATARLQSEWLARCEMNCSRRASVVTAAGWSDCEDLRARGIPALWFPTPVRKWIIDVPAVSPWNNLRFGLLANFRYWPNVVAYNKIVREWWPVLSEYGTMLVAGHGCETLPSPPDGIRTIGPVSSPALFYNDVDVVLAPVDRGGGMKVKIAEALVNSKLVITTPPALEGFPPAIQALCFSVSDPKGLRELPYQQQANALATGAHALDPLTYHASQEAVGSILKSLHDEHRNDSR